MKEIRDARSTDLPVVFQGEHGAYSEEAARTFFDEHVRTRPSRLLREVFAVVEDGACEFGVVPAENSLEGTINQTYDLLLQTPLRICGEVKIRVSHCLLALPGAKLDEIRIVYSHPQALAQCQAFLQTLNATDESVYDTAGSAKLVQERDRHDIAAIASERTAALYGLQILRKEIEDSPENYTRFFVIGKHDSPQSGKDKTSIVFATKHTPGALYSALAALATRAINLTKIESRPIRGKPWEYNFFVDFEGHQSDAVCADALIYLKANTTFLKILGSYERAGTD